MKSEVLGKRIEKGYKSKKKLKIRYKYGLNFASIG